MPVGDCMASLREVISIASAVDGCWPVVTVKPLRETWWAGLPRVVGVTPFDSACSAGFRGAAPCGAVGPGPGLDTGGGTLLGPAAGTGRGATLDVLPVALPAALTAVEVWEEAAFAAAFLL